MIITLSGEPGSGKSTAAKLIAEKLGLKHYSMGDLRREMAMKAGMTLAEFNKLGEQEFFTDKKVDEYQKELGKKEDNFVIDGRLSWHFIPNSLKIFLKVKKEAGAERIFEHGRDSEKCSSLKEAVAKVEERESSDRLRYKKYYDLDPFDTKHYDFVLDTTYKTVEETSEEIANFIKRTME